MSHETTEDNVLISLQQMSVKDIGRKMSHETTEDNVLISLQQMSVKYIGRWFDGFVLSLSANHNHYKKLPIQIYWNILSPKNKKNSDKTFWHFSYFCSKT